MIDREISYELILDNIKRSSGSGMAGELNLSVPTEAKGVCTVTGSDAQYITISIDDEAQTITVSGSKKVKKNSVVINVEANVNAITARKCQLKTAFNFDATDKVSININGTYQGTIQAKVDELSLVVHGTCAYDISGEANRLELSILGVADINATRMMVQDADVDISGTASCAVYASNELKAALEGVGSITYVGNPKVVNRNVRGIGTISGK